jgi:lipopolysaccharide biosynthesis regulator YciM
LTEGALLAIPLAAIAGLLAGRSWMAAKRWDLSRAPFRGSSHHLLGLHYLSTGQLPLAVTELTKVLRNNPAALEVELVLGNLLREIGQTERAIEAHQRLLAQPDLSNAERSLSLACLGMDFQRAGFVDRAEETFTDTLDHDPQNVQALVGLQKLREDQRQWQKAYEIQTRLSRTRKTDDRLALGFLQAALGQDALAAGDGERAEKAFSAALDLDPGVFPARLGLADLRLPKDPRGAASILEEAVRISPERAYLAFDRLSRAYTASAEPSRFLEFCEGMIQKDPGDWRARLALARHLSSGGEAAPALGLLLRALGTNPQVLILHLEVWRTLRELGVRGDAVDRYVATAEEVVVYADPHICTACRYRAGDMLWRCPHCHQWNTFVEERHVAGAAGES